MYTKKEIHTLVGVTSIALATLTGMYVYTQTDRQGDYRINKTVVYPWSIEKADTLISDTCDGNQYSPYVPKMAKTKCRDIYVISEYSNRGDTIYEYKIRSFK
jgi:hypothetical protein